MSCQKADCELIIPTGRLELVSDLAIGSPLRHAHMGLALQVDY